MIEGIKKEWIKNSWENEQGNTVHMLTVARGNDRYYYDFKACKSEDGWKQFDTDQDAWYFGVWVHMEKMITVTYAEGDETIVECETKESFKDELQSMIDFYGDPPPAFRHIAQNGQVTDYYDERPDPNKV